MAKTSKLEKTAEKAYDKAKDAVADAKKAAKKVAKKKRPAIADLKADLKKVKKTLETSTSAPAKTKTAKGASEAALYSPPVPEVEVVAPGVTEDLHAQTLIALRALAKSKGLTNYARLPKAALIAKIEQA